MNKKKTKEMLMNETDITTTIFNREIELVTCFKISNINQKLARSLFATIKINVDKHLSKQ